ncbi:MAG: DUF364 domain-containing protein [Deltaproteobacteria bacterium]|nr:DUF364 domain-containing protein [Deltaproteobacteria bacterium]
MKVLDDLISSLQVDVPVRDIRQGIFHTGVLSRHCGLAATLPRDALRQDPPLVKEPGSLLEKSAGELAAMAYSESILEAAMGMAAINSLLDIDDRSCVEQNGAELVLEKGRGKRVAVVGHFPFVKRIRKHADTLWIIENNPKPGDFPGTEADRLIPRADVLCITGTSLTNHTWEHLMRLRDPAAYVVMIGDTVPLSPVLFDWGVDALAGTTVVEPALALRCVSQGANFRQIKGVRRVTMVK